MVCVYFCNNATFKNIFNVTKQKQNTQKKISPKVIQWLTIQLNSLFDFEYCVHILYILIFLF